MIKVSRTLLHRNIFIISALVIAFSGFASLAAAQDAQSHMIRGATALEFAESNADFRDALKEFEAAVRLEPNWSAPQFNLGLVHEALTNYAEATRHFRRYLELEPAAEDSEEVRAKIIRLTYLAERKTKRERSGAWLVGGEWRVAYSTGGTWQPMTRFICTFRQNGASVVEIGCPTVEKPTDPGFSERYNVKWSAVQVKQGLYIFEVDNALVTRSGKISLRMRYRFALKRISDDNLEGTAKRINLANGGQIDFLKYRFARN